MIPGDNEMTAMNTESSVLTNALEQLRLRLLDLTGRNRLINFKHTAGKSMQFVEGQPAAIYEKLVEANNQNAISILALPEPAKEDYLERNGRVQRPEPRDWAKSMGIWTSYDLEDEYPSSAGSNVRALMYPDDLAKHCRKIEREAALAIEETGANMLFLVLGFLEFPEQRDSDKVFSAPLICIPVSLEKIDSKGAEKFQLRYTQEDIEENSSLREKLRNDFGLVLPEMSEDQVDVDGYFNEIYEVIENQPGFSLKNRVSLCLLLLDTIGVDIGKGIKPPPGVEGWVDKELIRVVLEGGDATSSGFSFAEEHRVEEGPGASIPLVYDADSSQHSALIDVLSLKKNLVIEGPPGTGKSQTITNLIAACLAEGKKVLFVAEKLAALEVVRNRLALAGLDPFVLELHSNKTNKKRLLEEIAKRVAFRPQNPNDLPRLQQQLEAHRQDLKAYTDLINSITHNAFGLTLHQIMWRAEKHRQRLGDEESMLSQITVGDATQISEFELGRRMDCLGYLASQYQAVGGFDDGCAFWGFYPGRLIPGDEVKLANLFESAEGLGLALVEAAKHMSRVLGGRVQNLTLAFCNDQLAVLNKLLETANHQLPLHLIPGFFEGDETGARAAMAIGEFAEQVDRFHRLEETVSTALKLESSVTQPALDDLSNLQRSGEALGADLGALNDLRNLHQQLGEALAKLSSSHDALTSLLGGRGIPYDGSRQKLEQLLSFSNLVLEAPEEHFHLQTPGLTRDGAVQAIERLHALQNEWTCLEKSLGDTLYVDALPHEGDIKQAILTLREGDAWYRMFQGPWRKALRLHKSLQRAKLKLPLHKRLEELEQITKLLNLKDEWKASPTWTQFLGFPSPVAPIPLEGYLALARWNRQIKVASEDVEAVLIDPITFTADQARSLRREFSGIKIELSAARSALDSINAKLKRLPDLGGGNVIDNVIERAVKFSENLEGCFDWLELGARSNATLGQIIAGCEAALNRSRLRAQIHGNSQIKQLLGDLYQDVDTDCSVVSETLSFGQSIDGLNLAPQVKHKLRSRHPVEACREVIAALDDVRSGLENVESFSDALAKFGSFELDSWTGSAPDEDLEIFGLALHDAARIAIEDKDRLIPWSFYLTRRKEAIELSLAEFVGFLEERRIKPEQMADAYAYCIYSTITQEAFRNIPQLGRFTGLKHNQIREEFKRLDKEIIALRGKAIAYECVRKSVPPPGRNGARVDDRSEMVLLNYLLPQQRPRMPVRKILSRAGGAIQALKPCFMMGPQAVAKYLAPGVFKFDLVVMDEASQLKPEEAIGSIARGGQLVVVGDPKQLPPTSFFSRMAQDGDGGEEHFATSDAESILDVCSAQFRPTRSLRWHYRSQHHSLIAFSNHYFYGGKLVIFPSPYGQGGNLGVRAVYLADAIYENQTNLREARRVVDAVVDHIATRPNDSLGVATLNIKQRDLIAELLEERLRSAPGADAYREYWASEGEPLFIKNLENVQGDERDAIVISTTFGKPPGSSAVRQNFGPISRQGGWRRLNVLFTRAKKSIAIYTSLRPEDIVMDGTTPDGTKALRNYLEYARTGSLTTVEETGREPDSEFEISVMEVLKLRDYEVTPQLGVAGYRIDIAVKHPDAPGAYLAAIECDGATYHSALSVRDRDRIRQEILESLGWRGRIWRIWSTDWFRSPRQETEKLIGFIEDLRAGWRPEHTSGEGWIEEGQVSGQASSDSAQQVVPAENSVQAEMEREAISSVLIANEDDLEIDVGDVVRYVDLTKPTDVLMVQITSGKDDFANGVVNETRPLAQALIGAVVGDEVALHFAGGAPKTFQIIEIRRSK